ncbi:MAG: hypothetical protein HYZ15_07870 [Sphingobacteriales bacterium]|nr:hypothetical protein [Sphingobacteriales bacterium]
MSNTIRHKLSDFESVPPPGTWEQLQAELEGLNEWRSLANKLNDAENEPPAGHWNRVLSQLEESDLAGKLYPLEETPPVLAWKKIRKTLEMETVHPARQKTIPWFRHAAAAAILVIVGLGILRLTQSRNEEPEMATRQDSLPVNNSITTDNSKEELTKLVVGIPADNEDARNDAALEASKKTLAKLDLPNRRIARDVSNFYFTSTAETDPSGRDLAINNSSGLPDPAVAADRYITLMTPEGNIIRVSKKLSGMVCCISGEKGDPACENQLKKWREKIVASSIGHSADSFMDILMLVNSAEETRND